MLSAPYQNVDQHYDVGPLCLIRSCYKLELCKILVVQPDPPLCSNCTSYFQTFVYRLYISTDDNACTTGPSLHTCSAMQPLHYSPTPMQVGHKRWVCAIDRSIMLATNVYIIRPCISRSRYLEDILRHR